MPIVDLSLTEEQELLRNSVREFVRRECSLPSVREWEESDIGFSRDIWEKISKLGWTGILIPTQYGGSGATLMDAAIVSEEIGWALLPTPLHSSAILSALILLADDGGRSHSHLLGQIANGSQIATLAFTEAWYDWTPNSVTLMASSVDDSFVLNGVKLFVPDAQAADFLICAARISDSDIDPEAITLILVDRNNPGLSLRTMDGFVGDKLSEIIFDNVRVPKSQLIGTQGHGWTLLSPVLDKATAVLCAYAVGAGQHAFDMTLEYSQNRIQFGRPISYFQRVQDHLVDMVTNLDASRLTTYEALWRLDAWETGAEEAVSVAKATASDGFYSICDSAHNVHAGVGIDKRYGLYLFTKKASSFYNYLGGPGHHRKRLANLLAL